jgi:hypothetical protein
MTQAGWGGDENFVFTTNTGIPTISSTFNCYSTISGNQVISGAGAPSTPPNGPTGGAGVFIINNTNPYTSLTITGDGGYQGAFINICDFNVEQVTQTPTPTKTSTPTVSQTLTPTKTQTQTNTTTVTPTKTSTITPTRSIGATPPSTQTPTSTSTPTVTQTQTNTKTNTVTQTKTPTQTIGITPSNPQTTTPTVTNTNTNTKTQTPTQTKTPTNTPTPTTTLPKTPDPTLTQTMTPTVTKTKTQTPTNTLTNTTTQTKTPTPSGACQAPQGLIDIIFGSQYTINGTISNTGGFYNPASMCNTYYLYTASTNSSVGDIPRYYTGGTPTQGGRIYGSTINCSCSVGNRQYGVNKLNPSLPINKTDGLRVVQWVISPTTNGPTCFYEEINGPGVNSTVIPPGTYYYDCP